MFKKCRFCNFFWLFLIVEKKFVRSSVYESESFDWCWIISIVFKNTKERKKKKAAADELNRIVFHFVVKLIVW